MEKSRYQFRPLSRQQIRIIVLFPGLGNDAIKCEINHVSLTDNTRYYALSYCWGGLTTETAIVCDGLFHLHITKSLHQALRSIRSTKRKRALWVDAVSINQSDHEERSHQVSLMRHIYQNAHSVLIWLGERDEDSKIAIRFLNSSPTGKNWLCTATLDGQSRYQKLISDPRWFSVMKLLERPYFRRVWVIQEVVVAKKGIILCGRDKTSLLNLTQMLPDAVSVSALMGRNTDGWSQFSHVSALSEQYGPYVFRTVPALEILFQFRRSLATDPRDKIFALYGLIENHLPPDMTISLDYSSTVREVYKQFATSFLTHSHSLDLLSIPRVQGRAGYPTWVPEWNASDGTPSWLWEFSDILNYQKTSPNPWRASGDSESSPEFSAEGNVLVIHGHVSDRISQVGELLPVGAIASKEVSKATLRVLCAWESLVSAFGLGRYKTDEYIFDAYWKTIMAGRCINHETAISATRVEFFFWRLSPKMLMPFILSHTAHETKQFSWWKRCILAAVLAAYTIYLVLNGLRSAKRESWSLLVGNSFRDEIRAEGRRLIKTQNGYIGLAPNAVVVGDKIGIFRGGKAPLIIREQGTCWELVGDSYIHGIMHGEVFKPDDCERMQII